MANDAQYGNGILRADRLQYLLRQPYAEAVKNVRRELLKHGYTIVFDLDVAGRIESELGVKTPPARLFGVCRAAYFIEAAFIHPLASVGLPARLFVTSRHPVSHICLSSPLDGGGAAWAIPSRNLTNELCSLLETLGGSRLAA